MEDVPQAHPLEEPPIEGPGHACIPYREPLQRVTVDLPYVFGNIDAGPAVPAELPYKENLASPPAAHPALHQWHVFEHPVRPADQSSFPASLPHLLAERSPPALHARISRSLEYDLALAEVVPGQEATKILILIGARFSEHAGPNVVGDHQSGLSSTLLRSPGTADSMSATGRMVPLFTLRVI